MAIRSCRDEIRRERSGLVWNGGVKRLISLYLQDGGNDLRLNPVGLG